MVSLKIVIESQPIAAPTRVRAMQAAITCPWGTPTQADWDKFWSQGDVNRDGTIDTVDIDLIKAQMGWIGPPGGIPEDINSDGKVDVLDSIICVQNQGMDICTFVPPPPPPEEIHHGKAIDQVLDSNFWETQPEKVIGVSDITFHHEEEVNLRFGRHIIEYGVSTGVWTATITIDGKTIGVADVMGGQHLRAPFFVGFGLLFKVIRMKMVRPLRLLKR